MGKKTLTILWLCVMFHAIPALADKKADKLYERAVRQHGTASMEQIFSLYARAAEAGHAAAQYNVAMMYSNGEAVNVDYQQAVIWFQKSSDQNFAPAKFRLGGHESAQRYIAMLQASPGKRLTREQQDRYWAQQRNYLVEMAAVFGVREAEEAVGESPAVEEMEPR